MLQLIKRWIKYLLKIGAEDPTKELKPFYSLQANTNFNAANLIIRNKNVARHCLSIGANSQVEGRFIFETQNGSISVGDRTFIGAGTTFISIDKITIGSDVMFSWGCTIADNNAHSLVWEQRKNDVTDWKRGVDENNMGAYKNWTHVKHAPVIIKDKAWIGFNVIILKGVTIGEGAIVGAGQRSDYRRARLCHCSG